MSLRCGFGGKRKRNGNCEVPDPGDGLAVQGVGSWSPHKHDWLGRFIEATRGARQQYLGPGRGGAAYIDLFSGPGLIRVRNSKRTLRASPLLALDHSAAPFSHVVLCDVEKESVDALRARTAADAHRTTIIHGDCNANIEEILRHIPPYGLNLAFIDPFGPKVLRWETLAALGRFSRMDMLLNIPTGFIKRSFSRESFRTRVDAMMGDNEWRANVTEAQAVHLLIDELRSRLAAIGYREDRARSVPIVNSTNVPMFYLAFFSKHGLADRIWNSVVKTTPTGQTGFGF